MNTPPNTAPLPSLRNARAEVERAAFETRDCMNVITTGMGFGAPEFRPFHWANSTTILSPTQ
jgi:hypothetical protein